MLTHALVPDEKKHEVMFTCFQTSPYFYGSLAIYYILKGIIASHLFLSQVRSVSITALYINLFLNSLSWHSLHGLVLLQVRGVAAVAVAAVGGFWELASIPLGTGDRVDVQDVHRVDLLETSVLGLDHEEEDDHYECHTAASEDQTVEVVDSASDETSEEGDPTKSLADGHGACRHKILTRSSRAS